MRMRERLIKILEHCSHEELVLIIEQLYSNLTDFDYHTLDQDEQQAMTEELIEIRNTIINNFNILRGDN